MVVGVGSVGEQVVALVGINVVVVRVVGVVVAMVSFVRGGGSPCFPFFYYSMARHTNNEDLFFLRED